MVFLKKIKGFDVLKMGHLGNILRYYQTFLDISSWTSDINWKDWYLHCHFDALSFPECMKQLLDISETYFSSVFNTYNGEQDDEEEGTLTACEFPYLDILVLLTEAYIFGWYFHHVTPLQELQLLEILCCYFQENKLDPVRYLLFDCFFGMPSENLDLQKGLMVCSFFCYFVLFVTRHH